jgi:hypothetical protein
MIIATILVIVATYALGLAFSPSAYVVALLVAALWGANIE